MLVLVFRATTKNRLSAILNPKGRYYDLLKKTWAAEYEDNFWPEDAIFLERNSRDFVSRIERINSNAEAICEVLMKHPKGTDACAKDMGKQRLTRGSETSVLSQVQFNAGELRPLQEAHWRLRRPSVRDLLLDRRRHQVL